MSTVELSEVVKRYGAMEVVHGISLRIEPGEFMVLVGPSGCGKSTTLRMVAGLEEISSGTLTIGGREVSRVAPKDRDVAMVFQNYALYPHLDVAENIAFGLRVRHEKRDVVEKAVAEAAEILGLTAYLKRKPADLSGGQRQRVAMGRAIVRRPSVFLFDEPLSNLDAKLRTHMRAEIKRLHQRMQSTSIYVTHDQVEAMTLADRIVIMNGGRIEQVGSPMDVFLEPANTFVASFIGSPPMNLLDAVIETGDAGPVARIDGVETAPFPIPQAFWSRTTVGQKVKLGIRPERMRADGERSGPGIGCRIDLVEPLGAEALLHGQVGHQPIIAKVETLSGFRDFAALDWLGVDMQGLHVFDAGSGQSLKTASP